MCVCVCVYVVCMYVVCVCVVYVECARCSALCVHVCVCLCQPAVADLHMVVLETHCGLPLVHSSEWLMIVMWLMTPP